MGIPLFVRDFQGSVGSGGNLGLVFAGFHTPAFSTALFRGGADQFRSLIVKAPDDMGTVANRDRFVQMFMDRHRAPRQGIAEPRFVDLPQPAPDRHRIVFGDYPLGLHREDPVQIAGRPSVSSRSASSIARA